MIPIAGPRCQVVTPAWTGVVGGAWAHPHLPAPSRKVHVARVTGGRGLSRRMPAKSDPGPRVRLAVLKPSARTRYKRVSTVARPVSTPRAPSPSAVGDPVVFAQAAPASAGAVIGQDAPRRRPRGYGTTLAMTRIPRPTKAARRAREVTGERCSPRHA